MIRGADGKMRPLKLGDHVVEGDVILTTQDGIVQLAPDAVPVTIAKDLIDELEPPGAGVGGGTLAEGLRVERIVADELTTTNFNQSTSFDVQSIGATVSGAAGIPPVANPGALTVTEDSLLSVVLSGRDPDGIIANVTITRVPTGGLLTKQNGAPLRDGDSVTAAEAAALIFVPAKHFNGNPGSIEFFVTDNSGTVSPTATVSLTVTAVNDAPTAGTVPLGPDLTPIDDPDPSHIPNSPNYRATTDEDTPATGQVRATDVDDGRLTFAASSAPSHGAVTVNADGTWVYTPAKNYNGPDQFTVTVSDSQGVTDTSTVFINVTAVNDAPSGLDAARTTQEDAPLVLQTSDFGFSDPDAGDSLTAVRFDKVPTQGQLLLDGVPVTAGQVVSAVDISAGKLVFVGAPDGFGSPYTSISFSVQDPAGLFASTSNTLSFNVTPVSDAPVAGRDSTSTPEDTPVTIDVLGNDKDADPGDVLKLTEVNDKPISADGAPVPVTDAAGKPIGAVTLSPDGKLVFTPAPNYNGPATFSYTVTDGQNPVKGIVALTVTPVNDAPVAKPDLVSGPEDTVLTFDPRSNDGDPEQDPLTITAIDGQPIAVGAPVKLAAGEVSLNPNGTLSFKPNTDFSGPVSFGYTVSDGKLSDTSSVTLQIAAQNDAPVGADASRTTPEDTPYTLQANDFGFTDADAGDKLAGVRIDSLPANGALQLDGKPVAAGTLVTAEQIAAGALKFVPDANENGTPYGSFSFSVQDQAGAFDPTPNTFSLNVSALSDTPVGGADKASTPEDTPIKIDVLANDSDADVGDVLTISAVNGSPVTVGGTPVTVTGAGGLPIGTVALVLDNGKPVLEFSPAKDYNGPANFSYTVTDGLTPVNASVSVNVTPVNDAPVARPDTINTPEDQAVTIAVLRNDGDPDGDKLTITQVDGKPITTGTPVTISDTTGTPVGTVTLTPEGTLVFDPAPNRNGPVSIPYTVSDPSGATSTSSVTVNVGGVNDAPTANPDTGATNEDTTLQVTAANGVILGAAGRDTDPENDSLAVSAVSFGGQLGAVGTALEGQWGSLVLRPDGSYTYTPSAAAQALDDGQSRADVFTYTVTDLGGATSTSTLTLTVSGVNDAPVLIDDRAITPEDTPVTVAVLANDRDPDGDKLSITQVDGKPIAVGTPVTLTDPSSKAPIGQVELTPDGQLVFTPAPGFNGPVEFPYTVSDGSTTSTAKVNLSVDSVNDAPVAKPDLVSGPEDTVLTFDPRSNDGDPEQDPLTITAIDGQPIAVGAPVKLAAGEVSLNPNGTLSFKPNTDFSGPVSFGYTVSDGKLSDTSSVTLQIAAQNDAPVGADASRTTPEDTPYTLQANDFGFTDADAGDKLAGVRIDSLPANGALQLDGKPVAAGTLVTAEQIAAGALKFVPDANENGTPYGSFSFSVQDQAGAFDPTPNTFSLNVSALSDTPVGGADKASTPEDTPIKIDVLANDSDADVGDVLTISAVNGSPVTVGGTPVTVTGAGGLPIGTVALVLDNGKPVLEFSPAKDYNGPANFSYTVTDGLTPVNASVSVNVTPVNDAPVAVADSATIDSSNKVLNGGFEQFTGGTERGEWIRDVTLDNWTVEIENGGGLPELHKDASQGLFALDLEQRALPGAPGIANYYVDANGNLGKLDPATGAQAFIGKTGQVFGDIAATSDGKLYGVTLEGKLYSIDPKTAGSTYIGASGVAGLNSMASDANGQLYAGGGDGSLYKISATTGAVSKLGSFGENSAGDFLVSGQTVYSSTTAGHLVQFDLGTGQTSVVANIPSNILSLTQGASGHIYAITDAGRVYDVNLATGAAADTGKTVDVGAHIYGTTSEASSTAQAKIANYYVDANGSLGKLDPATGAQAFIGKTGQVFGDIAATSDGKLYGVTLEGKLYSIDPKTAGSTYIGASGVAGLNSMASDANGQLYAGGGDGSLYKISATTGAVSKLGSFGENSAGDLLVSGQTVYSSTTAGHLVQFDLGTGQTSVVANIPSNILSLTQGASGHIYAITDAGRVYDVNLATGMAADTGKTVDVGAHIYGTTSELGGAVPDSGACRNLTISQTIQGLTPGQSYQLQFDAERGTGQLNASAVLEVYFGGKLISTLTPDAGYKTYGFTVTAGANPADNVLKFVERGAPNTDGQPNNTGTYLDNVKLTQLPHTSGNVLTNDSDPDAGDKLTVIGVSDADGKAAAGTPLLGAYGTLTLKADGSYTYVADPKVTGTLAAGQGAKDVFTYTVADGSGATASATLTINLSGDNKPVDASVGDRVWLDTNGNGLQDAGEAGVSNVTVNLRDANGQVVGTTTTDADGGYRFDVSSGTYSVQFVAPTGLKFTVPVANNNGNWLTDSDADASGKTINFTVKPGEAVSNVDAGLVQAKIANYYVDANGNLGKLDPATGAQAFIGKTGQVFGDIAATSDGKLYGVTLEGKLYSIDPKTAGSTYIGASGVAGLNSMASDANGQLYAGGGEGSLYKISATTGAVSKLGSFGENSAGDLLVSGQTVYSSTTAGHLVQFDLGTGQTSVVANIPSNILSLTQGASGHIYAITDAGRVYDVNLATGAAADTGKTVDVGAHIYGTTSEASAAQHASVGDRVWLDANGNGLQDPGEAGRSGVTVNLLDVNGKVVATQSTDANGLYQFDDLNPGTYSVQFVAPKGYDFTLPDANNNGSWQTDSDASASGRTINFAVNAGDVVSHVDAGLIPALDGSQNLFGGAGRDVLVGSDGNDVLVGRAGNDVLTGGAGADVFAWRLADQGGPGDGTRAADTITDFSVAPVGQGGDLLDLRDLLGGEAHGAGDTIGNLLNYLDIQGVGNNTEIRISTSGGFSGGNYAAGAEDQHITLTGVNLSTGLVPGQTLTETQLIETLMKSGKLITD